METDLSNEEYDKMIKEVKEVDEEQNKKYKEKQKKEIEIQKLADYIIGNLDSVSGYEGDHYLEWKDKEQHVVKDIFSEMAKDILKFLKK